MPIPLAARAVAVLCVLVSPVRALQLPAAAPSLGSRCRTPFCCASRDDTLVGVVTPTTSQNLLDPRADLATIKRRYRELAQELHPDRSPGTAEQFARLSSEYEQLVAEKKAATRRSEFGLVIGAIALAGLASNVLGQDPMLPAVCGGILSGMVAIGIEQEAAESQDEGSTQQGISSACAGVDYRTLSAEQRRELKRRQAEQRVDDATANYSI